MIGRALTTLVALALGAMAGWWAVDRWFARRFAEPPAEMARLRAEWSPPTEESSTSTHDAEPESALRFDDAALRLGMEFTYFDGAEGKFYLFETLGGGVAAADFDRDGRIDVLFPDGAKLPPNPANEAHRTTLFLRQPPALGSTEWGFVDVSAAAGADLRLYGHGAAAADFDNDGFDDLLITGLHTIRLLRNQGDGTFVDVTKTALPIPRIAREIWTSAAWSDLDGDGDLDAYVCAYADVDLAEPLDCRDGETRMHCLPSRYPALPDLLVENLGDGRFADVSEKSGTHETNGRGLGVAAADFTGDGKPDLYVANDLSDAYLWVNAAVPGLKFADRAGTLGVALGAAGRTMAGMGVGVGDYDRDGRPDLLVTDFYEHGSSLFANRGERGFQPTADLAKIAGPSRNKLGFGCMFLDADLDGWPDALVANGHVSDHSAIGIPYRMTPQLFRNLGGKAFADVSRSVGAGFQTPKLGRGLATADFDDDGKPDAVISNIRDPASLFLNRTPAVGHWLGLDLVGAIHNRSARNIAVEVAVGGKTCRYETIAGSGYLSSSDPRLSIGLGAESAVEEVRVRWPNRPVQTLRKPAVDRYHIVIENR